MLEQTKKGKKFHKGDIPSVMKQKELVFKNILTNKKLLHSLKYFMLFLYSWVAKVCSKILGCSFNMIFYNSWFANLVLLLEINI